MQLKDLANKHELSLEILQNFIFDFGIDLNFCIDSNLNVSQEFIAFVTKHISFIKLYAKDKVNEKDIEEISKVIGVETDRVIQFFLENGVPQKEISTYKTNLSSYLIHYFIDGDYDFILKDIPDSSWTENSLIGYSDLFFYITDRLDPFLNQSHLQNWGISIPAGILVYGPPGSGKIFWAKRIAQLIGYKFVHIYKDFFNVGIKNSSNQFAQFLKQKFNEPKTLLFIEGFEELMAKENRTNHTPETIELVNSIVRNIEKNQFKEIVIVGSVEILSILNDDITAPGRFDLQIPIFPPNVDERAQLILYHLTQGLSQNSPLLHILEKNKANSINFWQPLAIEMKLFSNTMIIDFTQSLKKRLYTQYKKDEKKGIEITPPLLQAAFNEAKSKINQDYLKRCQIFAMEAKQNTQTDFPQRFFELDFEIDTYFSKKETIRKIGFKNGENQELDFEN